MPKRRIAVVGAGPGGLTSAMILARRGHDVVVYEKQPVVGGRNAALRLGPYTFDTGPTFLMMTHILREVFQLSGRRLEDFCDIRPLDPMYRLGFVDRSLDMTSDHAAMRDRIERLFPGNGDGFDRFLHREAIRYRVMYPCLQRPYSSARSLLSSPLLKALPHLSLTRSLYRNLASYFSEDALRISFTFQAKYLGMSPWECPGAFTILPYIEHAFGIDHVIGGLSCISEAMARVVKEEGGSVRLSTPVRKIVVRNRRAVGIELDNAEFIEADAVVINADFGHAMTHLFDPGVIRKYRPEKLKKKKYSCSTFMLYLGLDKLYNEPHHSVIFAKSYQENIIDIVRRNRVSEESSMYVRNASVTDPALAPKGHSALYVLVPVPNNRSEISWDGPMVREFRDRIIDRILARTSMKDLRDHIVVEEVITPKDWENRYGVYEGATFNLGHQISQMLYFRPHNRFEEINGCYLVGGGTHPGSGLPTIYESARISADLVCSDLGPE